jgi:type VI secretion system secreted protein VgrG
MNTRATLEIEGLSQHLQVVRFEGSEGLSELFQLDVLLVGDVAHPVEIDAVLGKDALFTLQLEHGPRYLHGVVVRFQQADAQGRSLGYVATLAPRVHRLQLRHDCRIFQPADGASMTVTDILSLVLQSASLTAAKDYRLALRDSYSPRDYCAQYRESDWAFLSRLMEEEGIHYFFEHHEDKHVLVLADSSAAHDVLPGGAVRFHPRTGALTGGEHVDRFHLAGSLRSGKQTLRDYNFEKPRDPLESSATAASGADVEIGEESDKKIYEEIYDYPGAYTLAAHGGPRAKRWLQEQQVRRKRGEGTSRCPRLLPGAVFELREHPLDAMNRKYLITRVEHSGYVPELVGQPGDDEPSYENRFVAIPDDVPFRAPRITPRPVIAGAQTATVLCPSGEDVEPDQYGRVKVRFPWDREHKSSAWVRVGQVWAGAGFGAMFLPRKDQEVLVEFLEGDPDRPVIVGSLYHVTNVTPYPLPAEKTKSTLKSRSSPGGGGFNELRFEDKKDSEELYLHAQKDLTVEVLNDEKATVGHDQAVTVKNDRRLDVTANEAVTIGKSRTDKVGGDETLTVDKDESETIKGGKTVKVAADLTENVDGNTSRAVGKDRTEHVLGKSVERVDGDATLLYKSKVTTTIEAGQSEDIKLEKAVTVGEKMTLTCGSATVTVQKDGTISIAGGTVSITATGAVTVKGGSLQVEASGAVTVKGGNVVVQGGTVGLN